MSLQAVFKHKANAEDSVAPVLFDPATVETFEAKQKIEEREVFAAISNSHGEASVSNSLASGRVVAAQNPETGGSADKKRKEKERFAKAASDLAEWLAEMDGKIEQLRAEIVEHRQRAQELFEEAEELEELAEAIANGDELSEAQQRKVAEVRRDNPAIPDWELVAMINEEAEGRLAEARREHEEAEKKSREAEQVDRDASRVRRTLDAVENAPEEEKAARLDEALEYAQQSASGLISVEAAQASISDNGAKSEVNASVETIRSEKQIALGDDVVREELNAFTFAPVGGILPS